MADDPLLDALHRAASDLTRIAGDVDQARVELASARQQAHLAREIARTATEAIERVRALCDADEAAVGRGEITVGEIRAALDGTGGET